MDSESKHPYSQHPPPKQAYPPPPGYQEGNPNYVPPYSSAPSEYNYENNPIYSNPPNYIPGSQPPPAAYYPNPDYPNAAYPNAGYPNAGYPNAGYPNAGYPIANYPSVGYPNAGPYTNGAPVQINIINSKMPTQAQCHHCNSNVTSYIVKRPGNTAWIICLVLCCFCFPLCLYPLICDPCLDTYHICPNCQNVISVKSP